MATRKRSTVHRAAQTVTVSTGDPQRPTVILGDDAGAADAVVLKPVSPDDAGAGDGLLELTPGPTDAAGARDAITSISASTSPTDDVGASDGSSPWEVKENAQAVSGTPDTDSWGDAWVDRTVAQAGTHQANGANLTVAAVTAITEQDSYFEINCGGTAGRGGPRLVSFVSNGSGSTFTFVVTWPTVVATPSVNFHVDFASSATRPFVESTVTANTRARITSASPYSQRTFAFPQDGTQRTHVVTFTSAEVDDMVAKWLLIQFTVPDLTVGTFAVRARRAADATIAKYDIFIKR
jgi:hypothetical protein